MNAEEIIKDVNLLMEIFVRLPQKSVFRFKSVSKTWENIISTDPLFLCSYSRHRSSTTGGRLLAFLQIITDMFIHWGIPCPPYQPYMAILPVRVPDNPIATLEQPKKLYYILSSSNGLILTGELCHKYYVVNPFTFKWVSLPQPPELPGLDQADTSINILCEDNLNELKANYIVVRTIKSLENDIMPIQTYSSRTGKWAESSLVATGNFALHPLPATVANGVFHWCTYNWTIPVYDPNDRVKNHVQLIQMPNSGSDEDYFHISIVTRATADKILWLGILGTKRLNFFMLPKGEDSGRSHSRKTTISGKEWVPMHCISHNSG
ncbi:UNVERIFIED_CONTAM: putative F-box/kelch-repeat protein [Sesamum angustifolium]|uniref:F-box/kelch-repeat protein n=1 Tax=Sesamum angustifolium TaxID=2727405 RepID=A0AAW2LE93_9LAMI